MRSSNVLRAMLVVLAVALLGAPAASAAEADEWHAEQPIAASGLKEPLGEVGDIEFWAPNRGALITAGVGGMPAGVYLYDGVGWHLYSTVCGGHHGRIAWVGPDDFWTVSDQPVGQEGAFGEGGLENTWARSLCHFDDGAVVASYAEPLGQSDSYPHITAAACEPATGQCWFGGERLPGTTNVGAFHLFWNGASLAPVPSLTVPEASLEDPGRAVADLAFAEGRLYESVTVSGEDGIVPGEPDPAQPSYVHLVQPGTARPFTQLFAKTPLSYGGTVGTELGPFHFADGGEGLYAVAGADGGSRATMTMLAIRGATIEQVPLAGTAPGPGDMVEDAAAEPGVGRIWVTYREAADLSPEQFPTQVIPIGIDGSIGSPLELQTAAGARKGAAGPIACPAAGQCWLATQTGWLFHLGGPLPKDEDPDLVGPITTRPADDSTPPLVPFELPEDDSGAEPEKAEIQPEILAEPLPHHRKPRRLISKVTQKVIHGSTLQLSFTLFSRAHVQLIAKLHGKVVAATPKLVLGRGPHKVRLRLDPKRWPTHLDFKVHPATASGKKK